MNSFEEFTITQIAERDKTLLKTYDLVLAPTKFQLIDSRSPQDFKVTTLGGYPKSKVAAAMEKAMTTGKIEHGCYWAFQLLASGGAPAVWDRLLGFVYKQINIGNAKLPRWLLEQTTAWQRILIRKQFTGTNIINARNLQQIRNAITEMVVVLTLSRKRKQDALAIKIKETDFIISNFQDRCTNRNNILIQPLLGENDPSEIRLAANEFAFNLGIKNMQGALYWLNWILYWERINIKRFKSFTVQARAIEGIPQTDIRDVIWLIWSIIHQIRARVIQENSIGRPPGETGNLERQLDALWAMYIHRWKPSCKGKRLPIIIWSMHYLIYPVDWTGEVIDRLDVFVKAVANVNLMFEKMRAQCNGGGLGQRALAGPSLLDNLHGPTVQTNFGFHGPTVQTNTAASSVGTGAVAGTSGPSIDVIIKNNYKMPEKQEEELLAAREEIKKKKAAKATGTLPADSAAKLDIMSKLDRYLTT